jgi:hypothetical protein
MAQSISGLGGLFSFSCPAHQLGDKKKKKKKTPNSRQLETVKTFVSARVMGWNLLEICTQLMALNLYIPFGAFFDGL